MALLDQYGNPVKRSELLKEQAGPTITGVRSPISGYPANGLDPERLASILQEADQGNPLQYFELAELIEERDLHYVGVLGTRKRSVVQIGLSIEAASDDQADLDHAAYMQGWLERGELDEELFHLLDCLGKGVSFGEILWDTSSGSWWPQAIEWRDPRWFRFARNNLRTPVLIGEGGQDMPLTPFKFIRGNMQAKSGLPIRGGLSRIAAWAYMFKKYTERDWAIFTATYGQPIRVGKYGAGASEKDKSELFRAIANIAGDCAAMIPASMEIEFVETNAGATSDGLYQKRADWYDSQISKAVLGQTATTDAKIGGLGSGKEHRQVQEDIERADAKQLAAILNRDLITPWAKLEWGEGVKPPVLKIERPEPEDIKAMVEAVAQLVPLGLRVGAKTMREKLKLPEPAEGEELLVSTPQSETAPSTGPQVLPLKAALANLKGGTAPVGRMALNSASSPPAAISGPSMVAEALAIMMAARADPEIRKMSDQIAAMIAAADSIEELREMIAAAFDQVDTTALSQALAEGMEAAHLAGRASVEGERGGD